MIEAPELQYQKVQQGSLPPTIIQAHSYYTLNLILRTLRPWATLPPFGHSLCPASHSPGNPHIYA